MGQAGYGQLFEIRRIDGSRVERAALKAVFIPRERGSILTLMEQMGRQGDPAVFARELAEDDMRENLVLDSLKGRSNVLFCEEQKTVERPDGSGLDKLMRFAWCMPLDTYLQQHDLTGKNLLYFGMDLCRALESCRQAGGRAWKHRHRHGLYRPGWNLPPWSL